MKSHYGQAPFFFQYSVKPGVDNILSQSVRGCIATVIVFAESGEKARERVGKYIANEGWEITETKRVQLIDPDNLQGLNPDLKRIYTTAENLGLGALFDHW